MDPLLVWYHASLGAIPLVLAGVLWLARQSMRRTITVLSATALGIGLANTLIFTLVLKSVATNQQVYPAGAVPFASTYLVVLVEQWYSVIFSAAWTCQSAAWVLALYHTIQLRRGRWLALIGACAAVSSLVAYFAGNLFTMSYLAEFTPLGPFILTHPFGSYFAIGVLSLIAAGATLLYTHVGLRAQKSSGLVPGAVSVPTREARAAALQADEAPEDVVFVVEDVPRG